MAALGERWMGAGDNQPDVVFMTLGTGVGGGIVAEGKLLHGVAGAAGELGHTSLLTLTNQSHVLAVRKVALRQLLQQQGLST